MRITIECPNHSTGSGVLLAARAVLPLSVSTRKEDGFRYSYVHLYSLYNSGPPKYITYDQLMRGEL